MALIIKATSPEGQKAKPGPAAPLSTMEALKQAGASPVMQIVSGEPPVTAAQPSPVNQTPPPAGNVAYTVQEPTQAPQPAQVVQPPVQPVQVAQTAVQAPSQPVVVAKAPLPSFMRRGKAAVAELQAENARAQLMQQDNVWRYGIPVGATGSITFLDGDLDAEGFLDIPMWYQHSPQMNGRWGNHFVCLQDGSPESEPCPLCEHGVSKSYVGALTVIDHSEFTIKQGPNAGKMMKDTKRLFVAPRQTLSKLMEYAAKRGGLRGWRCDVMRPGQQDPRVGSSYDFHTQHTMEQLAAMYPDVQPYNYGEVIRKLPAAQLRNLGFGSVPIGMEAPPVETAAVPGQPVQAAYDAAL